MERGAIRGKRAETTNPHFAPLQPSHASIRLPAAIQMTVGRDLIYEGLDNLINFAAFAVIGWRDEINTSVCKKLLCGGLRFRSVWSINGNRVTALVFDQPKTWNISFAVTHENYMLKGHGALFMRHKGIYSCLVMDVEASFVDSK
ncbi:MAG: hypothetical protein U1E81_22185 [Xanthobacteraceae bacterium]